MDVGRWIMSFRGLRVDPSMKTAYRPVRAVTAFGGIAEVLTQRTSVIWLIAKSEIEK